jgi:phosphopantothenoylcysteine decarboxylase/phosphopantothenate--cysteine ligase
MSAAVADFRPAKSYEHKLNKSEFSAIELVANPDILAQLSAHRRQDQVIIGFAAQTGSEGIELARAKLEAKGIDAIYFNDVSAGAIFGSTHTSGLLIGKNGHNQEVSNVSKDTLAALLLDYALDKLSLAND